MKLRGFIEKINKIDKPLARLIQKKTQKTNKKKEQEREGPNQYN